MDKTIAAEARIMAIVLETISPSVSDLLGRCAAALDERQKEENDAEHWTYDPM